MIGGDGLGEGLQNDGLAGSGGGHDESPLSFADGRHQVNDSSAELFGLKLEVDAFFGVQRGEVLEAGAALGDFNPFKVDLVGIEQGEVALSLVGGTDFPFHRVAGLEAKATHLRG